MSKRIFIYRHAKSDWTADYSADHERPLAKRGIKSAKLMGKLLKNADQLPDLIISSTAVRALQTIELSISEADWGMEVIQNESLYYDSYLEIFEILKDISDDYNSVMFVGHEPKCSSLCSYLGGGGQFNFPTAAMARIDFYETNWKSVKPSHGSVRWLLQPSFFL